MPPTLDSGSTVSCHGAPPATPQFTMAPRLAHFVAYALHRIRLHSLVNFCVLCLLSRLKNRFPTTCGSSSHRLYISVFTITSKGTSTTRETNQMEREMCEYLEWVPNVKPEDLRDFEAMAHRECNAFEWRCRSWRFGLSANAQVTVQNPLDKDERECTKGASLEYMSE
ncbi:hypothetical protein FRC09_017512 [Ceratobasidium sp. 395]|nr:hypothetical protein FRC09_017512 [Ceratobasidium sp. 395]